MAESRPRLRLDSVILEDSQHSRSQQFHCLENNRSSDCLACAANRFLILTQNNKKQKVRNFCNISLLFIHFGKDTQKVTSIELRSYYRQFGFQFTGPKGSFSFAFLKK